MSLIKLSRTLELLTEFSKIKKARLEVILIGGQAMQHYGQTARATIDIDAEIIGPIEELESFLKKNHVPADLGEDVSRWSLISLPPGYRDRTIKIYSDSFLTVKVLDPLDFVIAKLRRYTEQDIEDVLFVIRKYGITSGQVVQAAQAAIQASPKDTSLAIFQRNINFFVKRLEKR